LLRQKFTLLDRRRPWLSQGALDPPRSLGNL
jgi:hypothetical protein